MPIDLQQSSGVSRGMGRLARVSAALALALAVAGCGGKNKQTPATPGAGGSQGAAASGEIPTSTFDDSGAYGSGKPLAPPPPGAVEAAEAAEAAAAAGADEPASAAAGDTPAPPVNPPGLDLSEEQKRAKIYDNLENARKALATNPPDAETGIAEAKAALAVDEKSLAAMLFLAHGNYVKGYYDKAEYVLTQAEKLPAGQHNAGLYFLFGLVYEATEREDKAESSYQKAASLNRNYKSALANLGVYHIKNKRYRQAVELYERLTGPLGDKSAAAWTNLGSAYRGLTGEGGMGGNDKKDLLLKAESTFKRATTFDSKYANAYYNLGVLYLDADPFPGPGGDMDTLKRLDQAKTYFEEYSRMPGADLKLAKEQMAVAQKLYDREERIREKQRKRDARKKKSVE